MDYSNEVKLRTTHYIITGFSIVVGLSWNETVRKTLDKYLQLSTDGIGARFLYSLIITFFLVLLIKNMPNTASVSNMPIIIQKKVPDITADPSNTINWTNQT